MIAEKDKIEIPISKTKTLLLILGCLGFVMVSIWLWSIADEQTSRSPALIKMVSILGILFFGLGLVLGPKKLFDKRPGLIIDDEGIRDNMSSSGGRFISWSNITGFETIKIKSTKILLIHVNNATDIINKESKWRQKMMRYSERTYGTPISIGSGTLKIDFDKLETILANRYKAVHSANKD